jgi:hypothetical protein
MQLSKIQLARSIWLFDTAELNPFGMNIDMLMAKARERYSFPGALNAQQLPVGSASIRLDNGTFYFDDGDGSILAYSVGLEIYADGISADTRSDTQVSDAFLAEFVAWVAKEMGIRTSPTVGKKRMYRSEIIFYADGPLSGISPLLDGMAESLGNELGLATEMTAVSFGSEGRHTMFSLERMPSAPFEDLKFYSWAMLQTQAHIRLINMFSSWAENTRKEMATPLIEETSN